jgi:hypothetical protein
MLISFAIYLSVDPVSEIQTDIVIAEVNMLAILIPITASFEFAVNTVVQHYL